MPAEVTGDVVIRGGTVFDGTGAPGRVADVAIANGVIRAIAPNLSTSRSMGEHAIELDASGCAVTPGFIDIHTHYDAQVFWDPGLRPSSYHGVTTVVAGNCGFTIAPTRAEHHETIVHTLENVEDMDPATLIAGVVWDFETFPEYLDAVAQRGTDLNFTAYIGHSALRLFVMGDAAYERAATEAESAVMAGGARGGGRARGAARAEGGRGARGDRRGCGRLLDELLVRPPRGGRQARAEPVRRRGRGGGAVHGRRRRGEGRRADHAGRAVHLRRRVPLATAGRASVHLPAVREPGWQAP